MMLPQLKIELYKLSHMKILLCCFLFVPVLLCVCQIAFNPDFERTINAWQDYFNLTYSSAFYRFIIIQICLASFFFLVFICYYLFSIENKNKCFNLLFTLPLKKQTIYNTKTGVLLGLVTLNMLIVALMFFVISMLSDKIEFISPATILAYWGLLVLVALFQTFVAYAVRRFVIYTLIFVALFAIYGLYEGGLNVLNPYYYMGLITEPYNNIKLIGLSIHILAFYFAGFQAFKRVNYR